MYIEKKYVRLITPDGFSIATWISVAEEPKYSIILCHGITVDSREGGLFLSLEEELLKLNFVVVRFDFRCHGESAGEPKDLSLDGEYNDLNTVTNYTKSNLEIPIILLGTSFSCSAVMRNANEMMGDCKAIVLWNPIVDYKKTFLEPSTPWVQSIWNTKDSNELPNWAFAIIPGSKYFITKQMVNDFENDNTPGILETIQKPILAFHGNKDKKIPHQYLEEVAEKNSLIEFHILDGEGHGFKRMRGFVLKKTIEWLVEILK